jgi:hypothetical protein
LLAKEIDVAADDRAEVNQRGVLARLQNLEKSRQRFGGIGRFMRRRGVRVGTLDIGGAFAPENREEVGQ